MRYGILYIMFFISIVTYAQQVEKVCGIYIYIAPEYISLEQARQKALERAKLRALEEKFGTIVNQQNLTIVKNEKEKS
ncbi:MAG: DUF4384 domain-containing protein, partial [Bacteroidales bacterium]|nr:DUF4384 domain-containing protein [Bacteroidales bacterium]